MTQINSCVSALECFERVNSQVNSCVAVPECFTAGMQAFSLSERDIDSMAYEKHPLNFYKNFYIERDATDLNIERHAYLFFDLVTKSLSDYYGNCKKTATNQFMWICPSNTDPSDPLYMNTNFHSLSLQSAKISAHCWAEMSKLNTLKSYQCDGWSPLEGTNSWVRFQLWVDGLDRTRVFLTEETPTESAHYSEYDLEADIKRKRLPHSSLSEFFQKSEEVKREWELDPKKFGLVNAFAATIKWTPKAPVPTPPPTPQNCPEIECEKPSCPDPVYPPPVVCDPPASDSYSEAKGNSGTGPSPSDQGQGFLKGCMTGLIGAVSAATLWHFSQNRQNAPQTQSQQKRIITAK